ncbi:MAG: type III pantothenate kinase [Phycisphaeraceae bacterium]|nr:type III pantothenate kinase [Phycisphaeraceae bacterium]
MTNDANANGRSGIEGTLVAVCVGNSRARVGLIVEGRVEEGRSITHAEAAEACENLRESSGAGAFVIASVNKPVSVKLEMELESKAGVYVIGRDLEIPMRHALDDASTVGQDRLLDAVGGYARLKEACVIADLGTAITIDFVDGEGTFQGGVIAPGVRAMMRSMNAAASALPELEFEVPDAARGPFGKDTAHAMRLGVRNAVSGLLRHTVEQFAERFGTFPTVIATGGDAGLVEEDPMVDRVVPDLQMMGVAEVCRVALGGAAPEGGDDEPADAE